MLKTLVVLTIFVAAPARPVFAMAPRIIMIYGGSLERPVFLTESLEDNMSLFENPDGATPFDWEELPNRPFFHVAMFWGSEWDRSIAAGRPVTALRPEQASQHGRLYPATGSKPAVFLQTRFVGTAPSPVPKDLNSFEHGKGLSRDALAMLVRHGIPVTAGKSN